MRFCVQIWAFHVLSIQIIFSEVATNPFLMLVVVTKPEFFTALYVEWNFQKRKI